jgi:hypothetical protein
MDQNSNVLRLFFNRLVNSLNTLLGTDDGGRFLYMPRGLFYSTTNQTAAATSTGYPVAFENTYIGNGVSISNAGGAYTRIVCTSDGMYNFQITLTFRHTNSSDCTIWTWINKNGTDVPYGGQKQSIKGDTSASLYTEAATSPHPGVPSTIVAVSFVSNL